MHSTLEKSTGCWWKLNKYGQPQRNFSSHSLGFILLPYISVWNLGLAYIHTVLLIAVSCVAAPHSYSELIQHVGIADYLWKSGKIFLPPFVNLVEAWLEHLKCCLEGTHVTSTILNATFMGHHSPKLDIFSSKYYWCMKRYRFSLPSVPQIRNVYVPCGLLH